MHKEFRLQEANAETVPRDERGIELAEVGKVDVIHGRFLVFDRSEQVVIDEPVKKFHGSALKGCDECRGLSRPWS